MNNYKKDKSYIKQRLEYVSPVDYISELEGKIEYLEYLKNENERLNNIIDELKKELNKEIEFNNYKNGVRKLDKKLTQGGYLYRDYIKELLIELEKSK